MRFIIFFVAFLMVIIEAYQLQGIKVVGVKKMLDSEDTFSQNIFSKLLKIDGLTLM